MKTLLTKFTLLFFLCAMGMSSAMESAELSTSTGAGSSSQE